MPPIPLLMGAYANLASEEWILQERQQIRSLYDARLVDFHQSYEDDVSWLNEYMAGLCEREPTKGDILQAMKTPSRFQSVRKLNSNYDLKGIKPIARLFSDSSTTGESSRAVSSTIEPAIGAETIVEPQPSAVVKTTTTTATRPAEIRGSLIIHHDPDEEVENTETVSVGGESMDISEDSFAHSDHESRVPVEEVPQPLNEITEEDEEEEDEVVTVLKTPHANPLHLKPNFPVQEEFLESPLAGKSIPLRNEDMDLEGSDKENNMPTSPLRRAPTTPRPSDRSDSYVTALMSFPPEEQQESELPQPREETPARVGEARHEIDAPQEHVEEVIETQVPVATSPPEHQMHLPSLPTRAPLNMKKSFGVRKSHRTSLMETMAGRASIIPNRKTFFGQIAQPSDQNNVPAEVSRPVEPIPTPAAPPVEPLVTPTEEAPRPIVHEEPVRGKKDKDDTITIIDTELHLGDQRLKTKFTTESQRIHDALNSLMTKSTPGQSLRDAHNKVMEAETPAPIRMTEAQEMEMDEDEDWIPKKDYSSLAERLATQLPAIEVNTDENIIPNSEETKVAESEKPAEIDPVDDGLPETIVLEEIHPPVLPPTTSVATVLPSPSPTSVTFKNAAAQAVEVIRNAIAVITHPAAEPVEEPQQLPRSPPAKFTLYPTFDNDDLDEPMNGIEENENFTVHYDDRLSLDSHRDSTYFTQSDRPSQPSQVEMENPFQPQPQPPQEHRQSHAAMPPPRKDPVPAKPKPVSIRVPTASQRQKEQQKKLTQGTGIYPTLTQSRSVPDLATPGKLVRDDSRMSSVSVQSTGSFMKGGGQIKALNAAKLAKQKEEQERERKQAKKFEMERKRQEVVQRQKERQEEERRKQTAMHKKTISKDDKKRPAAEPMRQAKKLPPSPKKQNREMETVKSVRPPGMAIPSKGVKHALEPEENKPRTANYTTAGKSIGQPQHGQDIKRRRTEDIEDKEIITSKPMRVSVVKQDVKPPTKSIGEAIRQPYTAEPKKSIKISSAHQHVHPAKGFMAPAEGVKFSNDPIPFGKPAQSQGKRSGPAQPQPAKETPYPPSESIILPEIDSEYSDSDDDSPKKQSIVKPAWAESPVLIAQLKRQQLINPDDVFGEIKPPAIDDIFRNNNRRGHSTFRPRSSSANWSGQDKLTREEIEEYARSMGYSKP